MEYRNLRIGEHQLARDLFESYYDRDVYCTEPRYFDWLHHGSPQHLDCATAEEFTVLAAVDGDRLAGCINYVPTEVYLDGKRHPAVVTTESLARPDSGGVYGLLARRLVGRFDYCFVMGATAFLRDLYVQHLGGHYCHDMRRLILVGDVDALRRIVALAPGSAAIDLGWFRSKAEATAELATGKRWVQVETASELRDDYWQAMLASGRPCCGRTPAWIDWRYFRHPHIDYAVITTEASQSAGIAVVRREALALEPECHAVRLLEFLPTPGQEHALAGAVARFAKDTGCALLDFFCAHDEVLHQLPPAFVRPEDHRAHDIPYLLQPPEWRERRSINLLSIRNRRKRRVLPELGGGQIYLTKGDGAQDIFLNRGYRSAHLRSQEQPSQRRA
ncbi:MAG: hypothetical protein K0V04_10740 [Deltaproteobacteria bacterium]|nr:hypothetical protein [Deltaproteobacteria bacterium]